MDRTGTDDALTISVVTGSVDSLVLWFVSPRYFTTIRRVPGLGIAGMVVVAMEKRPCASKVSSPAWNRRPGTVPVGISGEPASKF